MSEQEIITDIREMTRLAKLIGAERDDWRARCEKAEAERDEQKRLADFRELQTQRVMIERDGLAGRVGMLQHIADLAAKIHAGERDMTPAHVTLAWREELAKALEGRGALGAGGGK